MRTNGFTPHSLKNQGFLEYVDILKTPDGQVYAP